MTKAEAEQRCAELNAEHGDFHWFAQKTPDGDWLLAKVKDPTAGKRRDLTESTEARSRPAEQTDPRPSLWQNIPPFGPPG